MENSRYHLGLQEFHAWTTRRKDWIRRSMESMRFSGKIAAKKILSETNDANSPRGASNKDIVTDNIQYNFTLSPNYPLEAETTSSSSCSLVIQKKLGSKSGSNTFGVWFTQSKRRNKFRVRLKFLRKDLTQTKLFVHTQKSFPPFTLSNIPSCVNACSTSVSSILSHGARNPPQSPPS